MIKPKQKELLAALIICVALLGASVYVNMPKTSPGYYGSPLQPSDLRGESFPQFLPQPESTLEDGRIKDIRHWIRGELIRGRFEQVLLAVEEKTAEYGGYVYSEQMTYADDLWTGEIVSRIPQNTSTAFVFEVRQTISDNGRVVSITTSIRDITGTVGTSEEKPHATVGVTLVEISDQPIAGTPIIAGVIPYLSTFFTWVVTGIIIGLPTYFTLLGIVLLIDRALIPIANRLFRGRLNRGGKALPSQ